jgi:hypothetical protein
MTLMTAMTMNCRGSLKGAATLLLEMRDGAMGGNMGSTRPSKSDAGMKLGVPTSSRTSLPARIEIVVPPGHEEPALLNTPSSIRRGSGGPQKPFSWLSEDVRGAFTINTEAGEETSIPHLHILGATMCSWLVVQINIV